MSSDPLDETVRIPRRAACVVSSTLPQQEVEIRGRTGPMIVRSVARVEMLAALVDGVDVAAA